MFDYFEKDADIMSPTYRVFGRINIFVESLVAMRLDMVHPFPVQALNALPNLSLVRVVVGEVESLSPVAEVAGKDKKSGGIVEIGRKYFAVVLGHFLVYWSSENGN